MELSREDLDRVARLARLTVDEDEVPTMLAALNGITGWMRRIDEMDLPPDLDPWSDEPGAARGAGLPAVGLDQLREDVARPGLTQEEALSNAPRSREGYFVVRRILEGDDEG